MVRMSPYNNVYFGEYKSYPDTYLAPHIRRVKFSSMQDEKDTSEPYYQKFNYTNYICIQYDRIKRGTELWNYTEMTFYDEQGNVIDTMQPTHSDVVISTSNTNEDGDQYYSEMFLFQPATVDGDTVSHMLATKEAFSMKLEVHLGDGSAAGVGDTVITYTCDILELATAHEYHTLVEYAETKNANYTWFEDFNILPKFQLLIPSERLDDDTQQSYTTYVEQDKTLEHLDKGVQGRYVLRVNGITPQMMDTLLFAMQCKTLRINGDFYTTDPESPFVDRETRTTKFATFLLRDVTPEHVRTARNSQTLLWTKPTSGDVTYGITKMLIWDGLGTYVLTSPQVFEAQTDETTFITDTNTALAAAGINGEITQSGNNYVFTNAVGEYYNSYYEVEVLDKEVVLTLDYHTSSQTFDYTLQYADTSLHWHLYKYDTGAGEAFQAKNATNTIISNVSVSYTGATGTKTLRIFHKDQETSFYCINTGSKPIINNISGSFSSILESFTIYNHDFSGLTSLDLSFLAPAKDALKFLVIYNSQLDGLTAGWASSLASGSYKPFVRLILVELQNNAFNQSYLDAFYNEFNNSTNYPAGNYSINTSNQTGGGQPSSGVVSGAIATIVSYGWNVIY